MSISSKPLRSGLQPLTLERLAETVRLAIAGVVALVLFALYVAPFGVIVCGVPMVLEPVIRSGDIMFMQEPAAVTIVIKRDGTLFVGPEIATRGELAKILREARRDSPTLPLRLRADRTLRLQDLAGVFEAMREAGYTEFLVVGPETTILEAISQSAT